MADQAKPTILSQYADFVDELQAKHEDVVRQFNPESTSPTNTIIGTVRWGGLAKKWQSWTGTEWLDLAGTYNINISGNAATVTNGVYTSGDQTISGTKTFSSTIQGNAATATKLQTARNIGGVSFDGSANINLPGVNTTGDQDTTGKAKALSSGRANWVDAGVINNVVGMLGWSNYGNGHAIIDASKGISPEGTAINNNLPQNAWSATYPTLMGWNGAQTYGVRVDSARVADNGLGNTYNDLINSRALGVTYTNTSNKTIFLIVSVSLNYPGTAYLDAYINNVVFRVGQGIDSATAYATASGYLPVPPGSTYRIDARNGLSRSRWIEIS